MNKKSRMRLYWGLLIIILVGIGIVLALQPWVDKPQFGEDEVIAMVESDLYESGVVSPKRDVTDFILDYIGNHKWSGQCDGIYVETSYSDKRRITWNFYEKAQATEVVSIELLSVGRPGEGGLAPLSEMQINP